jgi:Predicted ATPase
MLVAPDADLLEEAAEEELLIRDPAEPDVWAFRSDVLRDVAYESLAKRERLRLHLVVADALSDRRTPTGTPEPSPSTWSRQLGRRPISPGRAIDRRSSRGRPRARG